jgi:hypothetical protein
MKASVSEIESLGVSIWSAEPDKISVILSVTVSTFVCFGPELNPREEALP